MTGPSPFRSWLMGGFESASMRLDTGRRVDVIGATRHDTLAQVDYALARNAGIGTLRDALRWHLIESVPGQYDWSSCARQIEAAKKTEVQIIWDLAHFGLPDWLDPWAPEFPVLFSDYAAAAAAFVLSEIGPGTIWCPVNEISYWAFAGGDQAHFAPLGLGRGVEWKHQLVRAAVLATQRIREVDPTARFLQPEPAIYIGSDTLAGAPHGKAHTAAMFESWDMISGAVAPELGGRPDCLDHVGINFYANNQWMFEGRRLGMGEIGYRPFSDIILEIWRRYHRPIVISETGAEGANGRGWLRYVAGEIEDAVDQGAQVVGACIYPIADYPGWTDDRLCPCGLIEISPQSNARRLRRGDVASVERIFAPCISKSKAGERHDEPALRAAL